MAVTHTLTGTPQSTAGVPSSPVTFTSLINLPDTNGISLVGISVGAEQVGQTTVNISATLGGQAVTQIVTRASNDHDFGWSWLGYIKHSVIGSTGNKNLVVTHDAATAAVTVIAGIVCFSGQDVTTPVGTGVSAVGNSADGSVNVTDSAVGDMVVGYAARGNSITSLTQTQRWLLNVNANSGVGNAGMNTAAGAAGSVAMGMTATSEFWVMLGVAIKQVSAPFYTQTKFQIFNDDGTGLGPPP